MSTEAAEEDRVAILVTLSHQPWTLCFQLFTFGGLGKHDRDYLFGLRCCPALEEEEEEEEAEDDAMAKGS